MIKVLYHPNFKKEYKKLSGGIKAAFSVRGDLRVVYRFVDKNIAMLLRIGTHNQVY